MEKLKRESYAVALGLAMLFGSLLAFTPTEANETNLGGLQCWTSASGGGEYLNCLTCTMRRGTSNAAAQLGCGNPPVE